MTRRDAFIRAVCEEPGGDAHRLVYADFLAENGEESRAEFIRVQVELAGIDDGSGGLPVQPNNSGVSPERWHALRRRELELLDVTANWSGWTHEAFDALAHDVGVATDGRRQIVRLYDGRKNQTGEFACAFRRGFVAEVTLSAADFLGGACRRCSGTGWDRIPDYSRSRPNCPACKGTGRTGGHAGTIFSAAPIERVTLTDKSPLKSEGLEDFRWAEQRRPTENDSWSVPPEIFRHLLPDINCVLVRDGPMVSVRAYHSEENAQKGLSAACVKYGQQQRKGKK